MCGLEVLISPLSLLHSLCVLLLLGRYNVFFSVIIGVRNGQQCFSRSSEVLLEFTSRPVLF